MKNKFIALLLCFFFGLIGFHKFYLGKTKTGIIYLVLTLTGVGMVVSLVLTICDFICLLFMSEADFNQKYNNTISSAQTVQ